MSLIRNMQTIGLATLMACAVIAPQESFAATSKEEGVVAIVNGDKILKKDVMTALETLPIKGDDAKALMPMVLNQIIDEKLIDDAVVDAKIGESKEYKERLEVLRSQLSKQMYIEKMLKSKLSDDAVKAEYNKFKKEHKGKKEIHARHILLKTEVEAKQVIKDLDAGKDFAELATSRSEGPTSKNGGDLGFFAAEEMVPEFSTAAFKLKVGSYTKEPVKTQFGYHVIKVEEARDRKIPELAEVDGAIRNKLGQEALQKLLADLRGKAKIQLFDADGKPAAAE